MRRFSLRHLFLLTSFFCLWFGAYAYWRQPMVFTLPYFVGIVGLIACAMHSAKEESERIKRLGWITLANLVCAFIGMVLRLWILRISTSALLLTYLIGVFLQGGFLCIHCFLIGSSTQRGRIIGWVILFLFLNLLVMGLSFTSMVPIYPIR